MDFGDGVVNVWFVGPSVLLTPPLHLLSAAESCVPEILLPLPLPSKYFLPVRENIEGTEQMGILHDRLGGVKLWCDWLSATIFLNGLNGT